MTRAIMVLALLAFLLSGCSNTSVQQEWKQPGSHSYRVRSALVVGMPAESVIGNQCIDEFVKQLSKKGIPATAGYSVLKPGASKDAAMAKAKELGRDSVLVCRFFERKTKLDIYPTEGQSAILMPDSEFWGAGHEVRENQYDVFGTSLYEAATGAAIWTALSDTFAGGAEKKVLESYVKAIIKRMEQQGLVAP